MPKKVSNISVLVAVLCSVILFSASAAQDTTGVTAADSTGNAAGAVDSVLVIEMEDEGVIRLELMPDIAPVSVKRIKELVLAGFYDGMEFHRVEPYLVQTGKKEHDYQPVPGEMFSQYIKHRAGMVGMARLPNDYDSATTQFYICKRDIPSIDGEYTLFARVVEGMDVVNEIREGDRIESCYLKPRN